MQEFAPDWFVKVNNLLDLIEREKIKDFYCNGKEVRIQVSDGETARTLWHHRFKILPLRLTIFNKRGQKYATTKSPKANFKELGLSLKPMNQSISHHFPCSIGESVWAAQNKGLFSALPGTNFIYKLNEHFTCLLVRPELSVGRLNRKDCVGKPLLYLDHDISMPRKNAIEEAIKNGSSTYYYEHVWKGAVWRFRGKAVLLPDDEILVTIEDNPEDSRSSWQKGYWLASSEV